MIIIDNSASHSITSRNKEIHHLHFSSRIENKPKKETRVCCLKKRKKEREGERSLSPNAGHGKGDQKRKK